MNETLDSESYASVSYLQQYQLNREPFALDSDSNQDDFFLLDSERAQRLNMLYHMCQNSELMLVVSGVNGSGKSSLLNKFIEMRTDSWRQCIINATTTTNPDQLLIEIAEGFGLPQDSVTFASGLEMLQKRLTEMKRSELMPILIIDDAHQLPTASLTILLKLSELADADERLLRIVLFGEPTINDMFNAPELKELKHRITHTLTMPSLDEKQTLEYIQYRLSVAGLQGDSPFSTSQMKRIHRQANGLPGLINQFAQETLLGSIANSKTGLDFASRFRSAVSIILILGIAGGITWYLSRDVIESLGQSQSNKTAKLETRDLPLLPPSKKLPDTVNHSVISSSAKPDDFDAISGGIHTVNEPSSPKATEPVIEPIINTATTNSTDSISKPDSDIKKDTDLKPAVVAEAKPVTKITQPDKPITEISAKQPSQTDTDAKSATVKKTETASKTRPVAIPAPKPIKPVKKDWFSQQNPEHFTLQLMGSHQRSSLSLVQRAHKLGAQSAIVRTQLKGADWYILIYKSFPDKQQARDAAKALPEPLRLTQPWPRRLGELKNLK